MGRDDVFFQKSNFRFFSSCFLFKLSSVLLLEVRQTPQLNSKSVTVTINLVLVSKVDFQTVIVVPVQNKYGLSFVCLYFFGLLAIYKNRLF